MYNLKKSLCVWIVLSLNIYVYKYLSICLSVVYHIYKLIYVLQGLKELSRLVLFLGGTRISRKFLFSLAFSLPPSILSLIRVHDTQIRREISLFFVFYTLSPFFFSYIYTYIYVCIYFFFFTAQCSRVIKVRGLGVDLARPAGQDLYLTQLPSYEYRDLVVLVVG